MRFPLSWTPVLGAAMALVALGAAAACGARSDISIDVVTDDGSIDSFSRKDTGRDAPLPPIDVAPKPDVVRNDCPDAAATLIYVITTAYDLYSFNPPSGAFTRIGAIRCPAAPNATPFSMAVDRKGIAYVLFGDGELFRVSNLTAACTATGYLPGRVATFQQFGMGFASDTNGPAETLYVASNATNSVGVTQLGKIDLTTFVLTRLGPLDPLITSAELTGTGDGRLFAFYAERDKDPTSPTAIGEVDKASGALLAQTPLPTVQIGTHWAFGFWGGDFYTFTGGNGTGTDVTRVRPSDGSVTVVGTLGEDIVGAGVSTCAPEL